MVAEVLRLPDEKTAWRRIQPALRRRWLVNEEERRRHPARLVMGPVEMPDKYCLPDPAALIPE